jgi:predicted peptidase
LLLFLHGAGERGDDNQAQLKNDALGFIKPEDSRPDETYVTPQSSSV